MEKNRPSQQVNYLIMSGGLGSSKYVRAGIETWLQKEPHQAARYFKVIAAEEPQLGVAKGLVLDRLQECGTGQKSMTMRIARRSYGVICSQRYDSKFHIGADRVPDQHKTGKYWATQQIDWFIKKV